MKKFLTALLLLFLVGSVFGQYDMTNWGERILFGTQFEDTDSLRLRAFYVTDSLMADTLYSSAILISGSGHEGVYSVAAYFEEISGTSASIGVDMRTGHTFYERATERVTWNDTWNNIFTCAKDSLYELYISPSDSTWFMPSTLIQYRLREADADTVKHYFTDYLR